MSHCNSLKQHCVTTFTAGNSSTQDQTRHAFSYRWSKEETEWDGVVRDHLIPIFNPIVYLLPNLNQHTAATICILAEIAVTHCHLSCWQKVGAMKSDVSKVFILASTIRNRANLSCAYVMWWRIKLYTHAKFPVKCTYVSLLQKG